MTFSNSNFPDKEGFYGEYGGKFVPETLMYALEELENTYNKLKDNKDFIDEFYKDLPILLADLRHYILHKD